MLRERVCVRFTLSVFFAIVLFDFKAIHERFFSYPNECPGEPGKKDVM
jgi:hypothetical protein